MTRVSSNRPSSSVLPESPCSNRGSSSTPDAARPYPGSAEIVMSATGRPSTFTLPVTLAHARRRSGWSPRNEPRRTDTNPVSPTATSRNSPISGGSENRPSGEILDRNTGSSLRAPEVVQSSGTSPLTSRRASPCLMRYTLPSRAGDPSGCCTRPQIVSPSVPSMAAVLGCPGPNRQRPSSRKHVPIPAT